MNLEEVQRIVGQALEPGYRGRLLARGQARAMIWRNGQLPPGAPRFTASLSYDLMGYGHALLSLGIRLREEGGDQALMRSTFEHAGDAFEAIVSKGDPNDPQRGFVRLMAAASFHLAGLSARAFSILFVTLENINISRMERALALLILRSLDQLEAEIIAWKLDDTGSDEAVRVELMQVLEEAKDQGADEDVEEDISEALDLALTDQIFGGLGAFLLALQTGEADLLEVARVELENGLDAAAKLNLVPQWWSFRLTLHLLDDLWDSSFHKALPTDPPEGDVPAWQQLRRLFIATLFGRRRSEIELWPSQLEAARRSVDSKDNLVVSLPTSAGKTRIAELCILKCLSEGRRVVFVTPLRALSAQTESGLQRTFGPLGKTISALYGSIGTSGFEEDALKTRHIVVATPEKLDFALRNDPTILDDVGLVVLDEGHMIGLGEREVRYEVQIQRLLRRADAAQRRLVCLSAIMPEGDQFDDFVSWIRRDEEGEAVSVDWRPTRIRFGEVLWRNNRARLELRVGDEKPFVPRFFGPQTPPRGRRKLSFPKDQRELVLATAWRLVEDGQSVLIYCPMRRSVEPFADRIVKLVGYGLLDSVLDHDPAMLSSALTIGAEWLGEDHPILKCLSLGVAVHHGALPTPFRKEMERLLRDGILKITVSSPTLAQGLNLTATAVIMHSLHRSRDVIPTSEFKNVIGRAGRAFIDVEGLVLFPIFDRHNYRQAQWAELIGKVSEHSLESGLLRLVITLLIRLSKSLGIEDSNELQEYVLNNAAAWEFPNVAGEADEVRHAAARDWEQYITVLDTAILSLLGDQEMNACEISAHLDEVLQSSLWQRRLERRNTNVQELIKAGLEARTRLIWNQSTAQQRRGYFLAGIGLHTGQQLDAVATPANDLLIAVNGAILGNDSEQAIEAITGLAKIVFNIMPFVPDPFPDNWRDVLRCWLMGQPLADVVAQNPSDVLRFIENGLIYKLPWAIESIKVRAQANGDTIGDDAIFTIDDFETGLAVPAIETGTLNRSAAILMQAGFTSRLAAIKAVNDTGANFENAAAMKVWMDSGVVVGLGQDPNWPMPESHELWLDFTTSYVPPERNIWSTQSANFKAEWLEPENAPATGTIVKLVGYGEEILIISTTMERIGSLAEPISMMARGVATARVSPDNQYLDVVYHGPDDLSLLAA
nr:DEAD/DEAH box helicase [uncultured Halomonas sp.]